MDEAKMELLGYAPDGTAIYFAHPDMFEEPGIYLWNGKQNVRMLSLSPSPRRRPSRRVSDAQIED